MQLKNEVALVTGASRGIGQAIALALGHAGAFVVGTATSTAGAESIGKVFQDAGLLGQGMVLDVNSPAAIEKRMPIPRIVLAATVRSNGAGELK